MLGLKDNLNNMNNKIIDTNVPLTSVTTDVAIPLVCRQSCTQLISSVLKGEIIIVIDDQNEALREYRNNMYPDPNPSAGLAGQFMMYLFNYQYDKTRVHRAKLTVSEPGEYEPFPEDNELDSFDKSDKKWIAISMSFKQEVQDDAPINNATDSDWLHFEHVFVRLGIKIEFLCKDILKPKD